MISSFAISIVFFVLAKTGHGLPFAQTVLYSVGVHHGLLAGGRVRQPADEPGDADRLLPEGASRRSGLDARFAARLASSEAEAARHGDHMGMATLGWVSGCAVIWSSLFAIGNFLYGRTGLALTLTAVFVVSGAILLYVIRSLVGSAGAGTLSVTWWNSRRRRAFPSGVLASRSRGRRSAQSPKPRG